MSGEHQKEQAKGDAQTRVYEGADARAHSTATQQKTLTLVRGVMLRVVCLMNMIILYYYYWLVFQEELSNKLSIAARNPNNKELVSPIIKVIRKKRTIDFVVQKSNSSVPAQASHSAFRSSIPDTRMQVHRELVHRSKSQKSFSVLLPVTSSKNP